MIIEIPYKSKKDGVVKLVKRISGVYSEDGKTIVPTGFMIRKVGTDELYDEAIDIENAPFTYEETDEFTEVEEVTNVAEVEEKARAYDILIGREGA